MTGKTLSLEAETVLIDNGTVPFNELFDNLRSLALNHGIMDFSNLFQRIPQPDLGCHRFDLF